MLTEASEPEKEWPFGEGGWRQGGRVGYRSINQLYKRALMREIPPIGYKCVANTYKVLSFGMWLKLATDRRLMLLLLRVLRRTFSETQRHLDSLDATCTAIIQHLGSNYTESSLKSVFLERNLNVIYVIILYIYIQYTYVSTLFFKPQVGQLKNVHLKLNGKIPNECVSGIYSS